MTLQKDWAKTQVRLPPDLHPDIKEYAKNNDLSMNAAIVQLLRKGLKLQDTNINEMDIFMRHLKNLVAGMPVNETSTLLANMVNSWIENKKPTA